LYLVATIICKKIYILRITILYFDVKIYFERCFILLYKIRFSIQYQVLYNNIAFFCLSTNSKIYNINFVQLISRNIILNSTLKNQNKYKRRVFWLRDLLSTNARLIVDYIWLISIFITRNKLILYCICNNNISIILFFRLLSNSVFLLHLKELRDVLEISNSILLIELLLFFYKKVNIYLWEFDRQYLRLLLIYVKFAWKLSIARN
jgi:hypothetical protein